MEKNFKNRVNFLIGFNPAKSLQEQTGPGLTSFTPIEPSAEPQDESKKYPNYCSHPKNTILPGKNEVGVSGLEGIPNGYCCYPIPKPGNKNGGLSFIFLPYDSKIEFWNETHYKHLFDKVLKINPTEQKNFVDYYTKMFPYGSVFSFEISGLTYDSWMQNPRGSKFGWFNWYFSADGRKKPYPKIEWTDPRNEWDKIVDEWGTTTQWVTSAAFFIAGFFTEGATWLILAEMFTEGSLGVITAQRDLEKGENISAAFNLIFGMTPFLKTNKFFSGIDQEAANLLVRSMKRMGLNKNSTPQQIIDWYLTLGETEQKLWSKMVKAEDEFSQSKLMKTLGEGLQDFRKFIRDNPNYLKSVNWFQKVNVKEITLNLLIEMVDILVETFYGDKLNDEEKRRLSSIYNNSAQVSQKLADEVKINMLANANKAKSILSSNVDKFLMRMKNDAVKSSIEAINTYNKEIVEEGGGTWKEYPEDKTNPLVNQTLDTESIKKLESEGYKREDLLTKEEWKLANTPKVINKTIYWKIKE